MDNSLNWQDILTKFDLDYFPKQMSYKLAVQNQYKGLFMPFNALRYAYVKGSLIFGAAEINVLSCLCHSWSLLRICYHIDVRLDILELGTRLLKLKFSMT